MLVGDTFDVAEGMVELVNKSKANATELYRYYLMGKYYNPREFISIKELVEKINKKTLLFERLDRYLPDWRNDKYTLLQWGIILGYKIRALAPFLRENSVNLTTPLYRNTALHILLMYPPTGRESLIGLHKAGADINIQNILGDTPLHIFYKYGNNASTTIEALKEIIDQEVWYLRNEEGQTPFDILMNADKVSKIKLLLAINTGFNINTQYEDIPYIFYIVDKYTILKTAGETDGFDPNARDFMGRTPLMITNNIRSAELLISNGAELNTTDKSGKSPLAWQIINDNLEIVKLLLEKGSDPFYGRHTAFEVALENGNGRITRRLKTYEKERYGHSMNPKDYELTYHGRAYIHRLLAGDIYASDLGNEEEYEDEIKMIKRLLDISPELMLRKGYITKIH